jgi:hypothetical protein
LRLRELEALKELAKQANARIHIGFDKHNHPSPALIQKWREVPPLRSIRSKKAGVGKHPEVFDHAGLLINRSPGTAGVPFI